MNTPMTESFDWAYEPHLVEDQLGANKYAKASTAIGELISNAFDARATEVKVTLNENAVQVLTSITIEDNGRGISKDLFKERFVRVGVRPTATAEQKFGRFGVGRFSVFRLGSRSEWSSISNSGPTFTDLGFTLTKDTSTSKELTSSTLATGNTGTRITIYNLADDVERNLKPGALREELLLSFLSYLLTHRDRRLVVCGEIVNPDELILRTTTNEVAFDHNGRSIALSFRHVQLKRGISKERLPDNILLFGDGKLCSTIKSESRAPSDYLLLVESKYFSEIIRTNRESLVNMDPIFLESLDRIQENATQFLEAHQTTSAKLFLEEARAQTFYPYKTTETTPEGTTKQALYDVALEKINEHVDLDRLTKKQQAVIFQLLNRAMSNSNILDVLSEVAKLSDEDVDKFRRVLERTTLEQVIRLSDEVTRRIQFLNSLHELTYGRISSQIDERKQLHKIIEQHTWIFGEKYQLSTSDKGFRTLIARHRSELSLPPAEEVDLKNILHINTIPDLYLAARRSFPLAPKHHNLIVEIKAPAVPIAEKEIEQIKKYANVVRNSAQLVKESSVWELFLVSAEIKDSVEADRNQDGRPFGLLQDHKGIKIWVFSWAELIQRARDEMEIVHNHLRLKTEELAVSQDLRKEFPFLEPLIEESHI